MEEIGWKRTAWRCQNYFAILVLLTRYRLQLFFWCGKKFPEIPESLLWCLRVCTISIWWKKLFIRCAVAIFSTTGLNAKKVQKYWNNQGVFNLSAVSIKKISFFSRPLLLEHFPGFPEVRAYLKMGESRTGAACQNHCVLSKEKWFKLFHRTLFSHPTAYPFPKHRGVVFRTPLI